MTVCFSVLLASVTTFANANGPTIGVADAARIVRADGCVFRDANRNGRLEPFEDWRRPATERAADLAARLEMADIFGLMLYSRAVYVEKTDELTAAQVTFLRDDRVRHVLVKKVRDARTAARWSNRVQELCEGLGFGIPANNSSDPRHTCKGDAEFDAGGGAISQWPGMLGMAATFDPALMETFGRIAADEYRHLGLTTALSPQIDLGTEPRWYRYFGTMGESPALVTALARAYCDGFQTTPGTPDGWGRQSVNTMVKHWPGGGCGEAGRDAHCGFGKYAVYPGGRLKDQIRPFTEGAFALTGGTRRASAVMPYYTISVGQAEEPVGNAFSKKIITDMLRGEAGYDGVVCTDWQVTHDEIHPGITGGKPWGVEKLTPAERHLKALEAGVDQFGGNNEAAPLAEAFELAVAKYGRERTEARFRLSARRLLLNIFRVGLFENPYLDEDESAAVVGRPAYMKAGFDAQVRSVVLLKNRNVLPLAGRPKVWIPPRLKANYARWWGMGAKKGTLCDPVRDSVVARHFERVKTAAEADAAIAFVSSPIGYFGYDIDEAKEGRGNGYYPIPLVYSPYTARTARPTSLAGGDPFEVTTNRTYLGKTVTPLNAGDLDFVRDMRRQIGSKPLIVCVDAERPFVPSEIEPLADALLLGFDASAQAVLEIVSGAAAPTGRLPCTMPRDMETVERNAEDAPFDLEPYVDAEGHVYSFGYGLGRGGPLAVPQIECQEKVPDGYRRQWNDRVNAEIDARIEKYRKADATVGGFAPGTSVRIEQVSHAFRFGAHIFNFDQLGRDDWNDRYKALYTNLFNAATVAFYWRDYEPEEGRIRFADGPCDGAAFWNRHADLSAREKADLTPVWRRPAPDPIVAFCRANGVSMHGHAIVYGAVHPAWATNLPPERLEAALDRRVRSLAEHYGDVIGQWDAVNESVNTKVPTDFGKWGARAPLPDDYTFATFARANRAFPSSVRFAVNDAGVIRKPYVPFVRSLLDRGADIDIVGVQMHIFKEDEVRKVAAGEPCQPNMTDWAPADQVAALTMLDSLKRPLHISEVTIPSPDDTDEGYALQARLARDNYRLWFSWPSVERITWWNVVDHTYWKENLSSGLFTKDMRPKPVYFALDRLINCEWKTRLMVTADENGKVSFRGFRGSYRVTGRDAQGKEVLTCVDVR